MPPRASLAALLLAALASACAATPDRDAPDAAARRPATFADAPTYADALAAWRSAEDVNAWIGARFEYDHARAARLSETQRKVNGTLPIHPPAAFFDDPTGVCVDLTRFAVETLARIAPQSRPRYFMIEFDPARLGRELLRRHWVAAFERDGQLYFFADSKRPGEIVGPYASAQAFVDDYARYRGRSVVTYAERSTYERAARVAAARRERPSPAGAERPPSRATNAN